MKKLIVSAAFLFLPYQAKADLWGADLPLLAEIVFNTLHTMMELEKQTSQMEDELSGIKDRIDRIRTISELVKPSQWDKWKDPREALSRLKTIYHTLPKEYKNDKSEQVEDDLSKAFSLAARVNFDAQNSFNSGKELERHGADASPGVAQKLTASGIGTLIALESQTQVIQSQITNQLAQMIAEGNEKESRMVVSRGQSFLGIHRNLNQTDGRFSSQALSLGRSL
jgi:hypothetical protein